MTVKTFVLAAGVGSRLEPLTLKVPKPLVPICNTAVMEYNIRLLKKHGFCDIMANLHYFPKQIQNHFKDGSKFGVKIKYSLEKKLMGTAGGVKKMARMSGLKQGQTALVLSADILTDIDLDAMYKFHRSKRSLATIALVKVRDTSEFGVVVRDRSGKIVAFQEKPKPDKALSKTVNTGIYLLEKEIIDLIPQNKFYDFGKQLFPYLVKNKANFYGYLSKGDWCDIGTIPGYIAANAKTASAAGGIVKGKNCKIDPSVKFKGYAVIGDRCSVGARTTITNSVIWSDVCVKDNCRIKDSVIAPRYTVKQGSIIKDTVLGTPTE